jgi:hypothetical protein
MASAIFAALSSRCHKALAISATGDPPPVSQVARVVR